ncbi:hypothetical protein CRG98_049851, partial [Punica granatum]
AVGAETEDLKLCESADGVGGGGAGRGMGPMRSAPGRRRIRMEDRLESHPTPTHSQVEEKTVSGGEIPGKPCAVSVQSSTEVEVRGDLGKWRWSSDSIDEQP